MHIILFPEFDKHPYKQQFLGAFTKLQRAIISFVIFIHSSVLMEQVGSP
jgi:hypothetical protein